MRGRRHKLQVSTFPFLAVLLCAMGSLILVLLVMDRKAHQAAQARAQREAARLVEEAARSETARQAERDRLKQQAQATWERKRDALHEKLTHEQIEMQLQMRKIREQLQTIAARLHYEQDTTTQLRRKTQDERSRLQAEEQLLRTLRVSAKQTENRSKESSQVLRRMTIDVLQMEQVLKDLKASRQREQKTFSVVPYHGRRGENRRPIYVECTADGVIFHPERKAMPLAALIPGSNDPANDVRAEVERRIAQQHQKLAGLPGNVDKTPYLLLLLRPGGVTTYHLFQAALKGQSLDFGYEFIDDDWVLDFPADDEMPSKQPWMVATRTPVPSTSPPTATGSTPRLTSRPLGMPPTGDGGGVSASGARGFRSGESGGTGGWVRGGTNQPGSPKSNTGGGPGGAGSGMAGSIGDNGPGGPGSPGSYGAAGGSGGPSGPGGAGVLGGVAGYPGGGDPGSQAPRGNPLRDPLLRSYPSASSGSAKQGFTAGAQASSGSEGNTYVSSQSPYGTDGVRGTTASSGGVGIGLARGNGRGHPSAMPPSLEGSGGGIGYSSEGSGLGGGSPTDTTSDLPGLGRPRALSSGSGDGYPGGGAGRGAIAGTGPYRNGVSGDGVSASGTGGSGIPGSTLATGQSAEGRYLIARANNGGDTHMQGANASGGTAGLGGTATPSAQGTIGSPAGTQFNNGPNTSMQGSIVSNTGTQINGGGGSNTQGSGVPSAGTPSNSGTGPSGQLATGAPGPVISGRSSDAVIFIDPLTGKPTPPPRTASPPSSASAEEQPPEGPDGNRGQPRVRVVLGNGNGGGESGDSQSAAMNRFAPTPSFAPPQRRLAAPRPAWVHGGRDWTIYLECRAGDLMLYPSQRTFTVAQAMSDPAGNPLIKAIHQMIERRQSSRRPGEPPYHPQLCLLVRPEHIRTFLTVYPALEVLPVPKTRRNLDADDDVIGIVTGAVP